MMLAKFLINMSLMKPPVLDGDSLLIGERLLDEVTTSRRLDDRLFATLLQQKLAMSVDDAALPSPRPADDLSCNLDFSLSDDVSSQLRNLLERIHRYGVQILTYSELKFIQDHTQFPTENQQTQTAEQRPTTDTLDIAALQTLCNNERTAYMAAINSIQQVSNIIGKISALDKHSQGTEDWRAELLQGVCESFARDRDLYNALLKTHKTIGQSFDSIDFHSLETLIHQEGIQQQRSLDRVFELDRQSLLSQIRHLETRLGHMQIMLQEEQNVAASKRDQASSRSSKLERDLKQRVDILEIKLNQEGVIIDDLKTSLEKEKARNKQLSMDLGNEQALVIDLRSDLSATSARCDQQSDNIQREQLRCKDLLENYETLRLKYEQTLSKLEEQTAEHQRLRKAVENDVTRSADIERKNMQMINDMKDDLEKQQIHSNTLNRSLSEEQLIVMTLKDKLKEADDTYHSNVEKFKRKLTETQEELRLEQTRRMEIERILAYERGVIRQFPLDNGNVTYPGREIPSKSDGLRALFELEKNNVKETEKLLEKEREKVLSLQTSNEIEQAKLCKMIEKEKTLRNSLQQEMSQLKIKKLEVEQEVELLSGRCARLKAEVEQLKNELASTAQSLSSHDGELRRELRDARQQLHRAQEAACKYNVDILSKEVEVQNLNKRIKQIEDQRKREADLGLSSWASEKKGLQYALIQSEAKIATLETQLQLMWGLQQPSNPSLSDNITADSDKKVMRLYGRYLRAESFRKALIYQKRYLLQLVTGYKVGEHEILAEMTIAGYQPARTVKVPDPHRTSASCKFRTGAWCIIAISRMKYISRKWRRAIQVGVPVIAANTCLNKGFVSGFRDTSSSKPISSIANTPPRPHRMPAPCAFTPSPHSMTHSSRQTRSTHSSLDRLSSNVRGRLINYDDHIRRSASQSDLQDKVENFALHSQNSLLPPRPLTPPVLASQRANVHSDYITRLQSLQSKLANLSELNK